MKTFDEKMTYLKDFLFQVVKPSIVELLRWYDRDQVEKWERNCCRQTSMLTNWLLRDCLLNNQSGYTDIQSWEGVFTDVEKGQPVRYDHAWVYCVHQDPSRNLLVDIARNHRPLLFLFTPVNQFPQTGEYQHMRCLSGQRMNEQALLQQGEYFSGKRLTNLAGRLYRYLRRQAVFAAKK